MTTTATFSTRRGRYTLLLASALACLAAFPHGASAGTFGAPATCNVLLRSPWPGPMDTRGVDVCAGPETLSPQVIGTETLPQYDTDGWQCVELAERFFIVNHWWPAQIFNLPHGAATDIFNYPQTAVVGGSTILLRRIPNGSITSTNIVPGDLLVAADAGPAGHVAVITKVYPDHVGVVEENYSGTGQAVYGLSAGRLTRAGETVLGVVHNPLNPGQPKLGFVTQAYRDLLGRTPDSSTVASWNTTLTYQLSRRELAYVLDTSAEYDARGVRGLYEALLGREPSSDSSAYWASYIQAGHSWEQLEETILASAEYYAVRAGGADVSFIYAVYSDVLGRLPSDSTLQYWLTKLQSGLSRQAFATAVVTSPEGYTRRAAGWYQQLLRRRATSAELSNNVAALQRGTTDQRLIANIVGSAEYEQIATANATA
jgi:hypothetical protein